MQQLFTKAVLHRSSLCNLTQEEINLYIKTCCPLNNSHFTYQSNDLAWAFRPRASSWSAPIREIGSRPHPVPLIFWRSLPYKDNSDSIQSHGWQLQAQELHSWHLTCTAVTYFCVMTYHEGAIHCKPLEIHVHVPGWPCRGIAGSVLTIDSSVNGDSLRHSM